MCRTLLFVVAIACASNGVADERPLQIISCGWNAPTAGQFARDVEHMPGAVPLTGAVLTLHADSGHPDPLATAHDGCDWSGLDVQRSIEAVAAVDKANLPDNYLLLKSNPGDVDWFDDQGWSTIVDHYRRAAAWARRAGLRGLLLDFEPYTEPHRQFQYARQNAATQHSFAEYQSIVRRRGREVMGAIAGEFPQAEIHTFFLLSYLIDDHHERGPSPIGRGDAEWCLSGHHYGLLPAFVDGWLDVLPKTMVIIDGCEDAYWFTSREQFRDCASAVRRQAAQLVAAENRDKYHAQIRVAFPIYLDAIHPELAGRYTLQPQHTDRLSLLQRNLSAGIRYSDAMLWLYGEHGRWWPEAGDEALWRGKDVYPTWEQLLPGISETLRKTLADHAAGSLNRDNAVPPAVASAAVQPTNAAEIIAVEIDVQPHWEVWRAAEQANQPGQVECADGQVTITAASDAAGTATIHSEPDRSYMIQVQVVQEGRGMTKLSVQFQTPDGQRWVEQGFDVVAYPPDGDPYQLRTITAIVRSPGQDHRMVLCCHAAHQLTQQDAALFGNLMVGLVEP